MTHVFISYAHDDQGFVRNLMKELQNADIKVWIDESGLKPSTPDWDDAIRIAIQAANAVLLIASPASRKSLYVRDELTIARNFEKPIFPAWMAGENYADCVPIGHGSTQYVDLRGIAYSDGVEQLIKALGGSKLPSKQVNERESWKVPKCFRCGRDLIKWEGSIMVDLPAYLTQPKGDIFWLRPYCPECIRRLDQQGYGTEKLHNFWQLNSVKEYPIFYLARGLREIADPNPLTEWHSQALSDLVNLVILALPDEQALDMLKGFSDWNLESHLANELVKRIYDKG